MKFSAAELAKLLTAAENGNIIVIVILSKGSPYKWIRKISTGQT